MEVLNVVDVWICLSAHVVERTIEPIEHSGGHREERRLEPCEGVRRGAGPRMLIVIERYRAVGPIDRHDATVEASFGLRERGALLAQDGECVDIVAGKTFDRCGQVCC